VLIPFATFATLTWLYLQPSLERCVELRPDWILEMFARNLGLIVVVAGSLHLYFYTFRCQGEARKFDPRDLADDDRRFLGRRQVRGNVFWTCASGVTVWTAYEVFFMWAYANDLLPFYLDWMAHPFLFVFTFVAIIFWSSLHFYFIHRLLHWRPLYRIAHALHHRNDNVGPWSGLSMHPIEHVIYLSSVLIHVVLLSHPIHILFHMQWNTLGAVTAHTGFEGFVFRGKPVYMPWDRWFGTDNDGTPESMTGIRERRRARKNVASDIV